jgi:hypothetical protein
MKILMSFIALILITKECNQEKLSKNNSDNKSITEAVLNDDLQKSYKITYETMSRGFFEKTWVTKDSIYFTKDRNLQDIKSIKCPNEQWLSIIKIANDINLNTLSELEPPSKMHQYDGAALATLQIEKMNDIFKTPIFDNGYPPKEIEELVNKVLSLQQLMPKD